VRRAGDDPEVGHQAPGGAGGREPAHYDAPWPGKLHYLNAAPISDIAGRWMARYGATRVRALSDLENAL